MSGLCYSCDGSGSDRRDRYGKVLRCSACDGTGERSENEDDLRDQLAALHAKLESAITTGQDLARDRNALCIDLGISEQRVATLEGGYRNIDINTEPENLTRGQALWKLAVIKRIVRRALTDKGI